ncbi:hypothetical protein BDP27DRAFT_1316785 [Rhodocollybia butyracea]|uniref:Aminoglycoside phosphotransferase domain-containing protein n=1 Tax=Rhodocollybia butyracea TaxID=206335 RepID=A0A9P5Q3E8_9AGAR|nr:hypothetical protein BDP27DRAFT_1316785 [Rhodocollybia butyracea]
MTITLEDAQKVISKTFSNTQYSRVIAISEVQNKDSYRLVSVIRREKLDVHGIRSRTRNNKTYILDLASSAECPPTHTSFITFTISVSTEEPTPAYHPTLSKQTSIPIGQPLLDTSTSIIPYPYLLTPPQPIQSSSIIPLSLARSQNLLTDPQKVFIDLTIGQLLGQLHSGVQNDWFGRPTTSQPEEPSYSWGQTFIELLEPLLERAHEAEIDLGTPYEELQRFLSRAIAFSLFDDVDVPSLIWFTGESDPAIQVGAILPNLGHALWGDRLLETFFLPPAPSEAVKEGYVGGGGEPLLTFPRQKTKRLWYTVFLALVVLFERDGLQVDETKSWALGTLKHCTKALKDAPIF